MTEEITLEEKCDLFVKKYICILEILETICADIQNNIAKLDTEENRKKVAEFLYNFSNQKNIALENALTMTPPRLKYHSNNSTQSENNKPINKIGFIID